MTNRAPWRIRVVMPRAMLGFQPKLPEPGAAQQLRRAAQELSVANELPGRKLRAGRTQVRVEAAPFDYGRLARLRQALLRKPH